MKGSSISVRIADFLKEYPPFTFLDLSRLRELAGKGRVKFHEDGEIVFSQGQPRDRWIYVIHQGSVRIIEETPEGDKLIDLRGPGDILGLHGVRSDDPYLHTCKTDTETLLYGLPRDAFVALAGSNTPSRRYLAAYFSLNPAYHWDGSETVEESPRTESTLVSLRHGGLLEVTPAQAAARSDLVVVLGDTSVREVALKLQSKRVDCVLVCDPRGWPLGKLTDGDLRDRLLEGSIQPSAPVRNLMFTDLVTAAPWESTGSLLLKLTRHGKPFLVITQDGTPRSPAVGLLSEKALILQYGRFPTVIGEAIECAPDIPALRRLRDRLESFILEFLDNRGTLTWLMEMAGILNRKFVNRIVELVVEELRQTRKMDPPVDFAWLMMGSGGRDELMIRSAVYHALVYADPPHGREDAVDAYFQELARRTAAGVRQCGFLESSQHVLAHHPGWCLPLSRMKDRFTRFIEDPLASHVYSARDAFDFQAVSRAMQPLAGELDRHIEDLLQRDPAFIRHMASDSLMNQPPRTIFQGYVVDREGTRRDRLAIKSHALLPIVDAARVLALESGSHRPTSTYLRLVEAARKAEEEGQRAAHLREVAEAFLVAQFARVSQGLKTGTDGAFINPGDLDPETRTLLVTSFRTILELLEATAERFQLRWKG